jgi:hypothetical protein
MASVTDAAAIEQAIQAEIAALAVPAVEPASNEAGPDTDFAAALELELAKAVALDVPGPDTEAVAQASEVPDPKPVDGTSVMSGFSMPQALEDELFAALTAAEAKVVVPEPATAAASAAPAPAQTSVAQDITAQATRAQEATLVEPGLAVDQPADTQADQPKAPGVDPFSVEAIEAEFARLLNRSVPPKA